MSRSSNGCLSISWYHSWLCNVECYCWYTRCKRRNW